MVIVDEEVEGFIRLEIAGDALARCICGEACGGGAEG